MKKIVTIMMMVVVLMGTISANAELCYELGDWKSVNVGTDENGQTIWEDHYYAWAVSDSGDRIQIEISEEEHDELLAAYFDENPGTVIRQEITVEDVVGILVEVVGYGRLVYNVVTTIVELHNAAHFFFAP